MSSLSEDDDGDDDDPKGWSLGRVIIEGTNEHTELVDGGRDEGITIKLLAEEEVVEGRWRGVEGAVMAGEGGSTMVIISMSLGTLLLRSALCPGELRLIRENLSMVGVLGTFVTVVRGDRR